MNAFDQTIVPGNAADVHTKWSIRDVLSERFSRDELETLCINLGERIKASGLRMAESLYPLNLEVIGEGKQIKLTAQRVVEYLDRRSALPFLAALLREYFPDDDNVAAWQFVVRG